MGLESVECMELAWSGSSRAFHSQQGAMTAITLIVNGTERKAEAAPGESLLSVLRYRVGLTGTKYGCGEGQCGACTVLIEGKAVRSCITPAEAASGKKGLTIEALSPDGHLPPVQQAFLEEEAFQYGYCTPGMILSAHALLAGNPQPSDEEIKPRLNANFSP